MVSLAPGDHQDHQDPQDLDSDLWVNFGLHHMTCIISNLYQHKTDFVDHVLNKTEFNVFQTFMDMEGSGFPDLESIRVRIWILNTSLNYVIEDIIFVNKNLKTP